MDAVWHKRLAGASPMQASLEQDQASVEKALDAWIQSQIVSHDEKKCACFALT